jgi:hypothetical protein
MGKRSNTIKQRRRDDVASKQRSELAAKEGVLRGCLFCRKSDGGFTAPEHILPQSMGNTEAILPIGVVCDRCNHGQLAVIDEALCEFFPVKMRRTFLGIPSKNGTYPQLKLSKGTISYIPGRDGGEPILFFKENRPKLRMIANEASPEGNVAFTIPLSGGKPLNPPYASQLSRALLKCAFEYAWLDHGEQLLEPRFDHVRDAILGAPRDGFFAAAKETDHNHTEAVVSYNIESSGDGETRIAAGLLYAGVALFTDSRLTSPLTKVDGSIEVFSFEASQLRKPRS